MELMNLNKSQTMSSLEIADLTGKRHEDVLRDIRKTMNDAEIEATHFCVPYKMPSGQTSTVYNLPRRECDLVVSGYSVKYRLAIIDRWQQLEAEKQAKTEPKTRLELAKENVLLIEEIEAKDALLLEQAPKVAVYEILADRKQDVSTTVLAKQLGTTAIKLNQFLRDSGVKWLNADLPKAGFMDWFNVVSDVKNGYEFQQCLSTPFGQLEIAKMWSKK